MTDLNNYELLFNDDDTIPPGWWIAQFPDGRWMAGSPGTCPRELGRDHIIAGGAEAREALAEALEALADEAKAEAEAELFDPAELGAGIAEIADEHGCKSAELVAAVGDGDEWIAVYRLYLSGEPELVATTNGDPIWKSVDEELWALLLEEKGIAEID